MTPLSVPHFMEKVNLKTKNGSLLTRKVKKGLKPAAKSAIYSGVF
jgi:hypothetical protein